MIVKICGITNLEDAQTAVEAGADMLGFNFYPPSPRCIRPETCAAIVEALSGSGVRFVGIFVNAAVEEVQRVMRLCRLDLAQLCGDEPAADLAQLEGRAFKALRPQNSHEMQEALIRYPPRPQAPAYLLDAYHPAVYGGSGRRVSFDLSVWLAQRFPILLAGGLTPENVAEAVERVRPYGVDAASGVESAPGKKDAARLRAFVRAAKRSFQRQLT